MMRSPVGLLFHERNTKRNPLLGIIDPPLLSNVPNETVSEDDTKVVALRTKMQDFCVLEDEESYSILGSAYYFNVAYKKKLIFYISQCNSIDAYNALMDNVEEEMDSLAKDQKEFSDSMTSCFSDKPHLFSSSLRCLIEATRKRLTLIEFYYYFSIIEDPDNRHRMKECVGEVGDCLHYISNFLISTHFTDAIYKDPEQGVLLCRSISSIYESLRCSRILSNVKEVDMYYLRSPDFLNALCTSYLIGYNKHAQILLMMSYFKHTVEEPESLVYLGYVQHMMQNCKSAINLDHYQQILGEYLQSELKLQEMVRESVQKICLVRQAIRFANTCSDMATVALDLDAIAISVLHLKKVLGHITQAVESLFDNEDVCYKGGTTLNLNDETPALSVVLVEEGLPRIRELEHRIAIVELTINNLKSTISVLRKHTTSTDIELKEVFSNLDKEIAKHAVVLSKKKCELKARELKFQKSVAVLEEPPAPIVIKPKKEKTIRRKVNSIDTASNSVSVAPLPAILKPVTSILPPIQINSSPEPTVRNSQEEQDRDKESKRQKYMDAMTKLSLVYKEASPCEDKEEFSCEYAIFGKPVKARLDHRACREAMGDQLFDKVLPKLNDLLHRARIRGLYGQGVKLCLPSEKRALKRMGLLDPSFRGMVFKLKPKGDYRDKVQVYGKIMTRDGEQELVFDIPVVGKVHKQIARKNKSMKM